MKPYIILDSTSELQINVVGKSLEELFRNAVIAMFDCISPRYQKDAPQNTYNISLTGADQELLLIDFLIEALYLSDTHDEAFFDARIESLGENHLRATIVGKKVLGFALEIKAVTHHDAHIEKRDGLFNINILFDI